MSASKPQDNLQNHLQPNSVGIVEAKSVHFDQPFMVSCGRELPAIDLIYETYGELNKQKSNAILVCHALSGDHHAAGYHCPEDKKPGWWDNYIGPGKAIDTDHFYVVSLNNIGGCAGSTGPGSINPATGEPWGPDFPTLRVRDWVETQRMLADYLMIDQWAAVIGGSLGGMQAMRWALEYPDRLRHCVVIASALKLTAQNIAFNKTSRTAISSDPDFHGGRYYQYNTVPKSGLAIARMIGHITYLSDNVMGEKFGRDLRSGTFERGVESELEFQVESYLSHQGDVFSESFDANTYMLMTKALDLFDLAREYGDDAVKAFSAAKCRFLVISFSSDWRFSPERSQEIVNALIGAEKSVSYAEIDAPQGHDSFLLPVQRYQDVFTAYMQHVALECATSASATNSIGDRHAT